MLQNNLIDGFGRKISYLRLSLTDRCDLRCLYCMSARQTFMPKEDLLTLDEIDTLLKVFVARGVRKIRLTGGEPLARKDFMSIAEQVARLELLDEWCLTTNATFLPAYAERLAQLGLKRVNVSLDSLRDEVFAKITRSKSGALQKTLDGIEAAQAAGLRVKINCVALAGLNGDELPEIITWAHKNNMDLTLIETMPMSDTGLDLTKHYLPLNKVHAQLAHKWRLVEETNIPLASRGPAQFFRVAETNGRLGFITPLSHKFCTSCNRVRVSADGKLWTCLGHNHFVDLRKVMRAGESLDQALNEAMQHKPLEHHFYIDKNKVSGSPQRMMATTGG